MIDTLNRLAEEIHKTAIEHGWWETERGIRPPSCEDLARICDLFGVSPNWMLLGDGADET